MSERASGQQMPDFILFHSSTVHKSWTLEPAWEPFNRWVDRETVLCVLWSITQPRVKVFKKYF